LLLLGFALVPLTGLAADPGAEALIGQGNQLDNQGDHVGAIDAYSKAIALGATYEGLIDRSFAYSASGHYAEAFQDLDRARALKPADPAPLSARYWFDFELYQFPAVIATIDQMNGMRPADPYAPLLRFIAASRLGQDGSGDLDKSVAPATRNQWPQAVAQLFLGKVTPDQLLGWVAESGNQQASCEAPFYVGEYLLIHHRPDLARVALSENQRDECRPVTEYYAAAGELVSLGNAVQ